MKFLKTVAMATTLTIYAHSASFAQSHNGHEHHRHSHHAAIGNHSGHNHGASAPVSIMGDHMHSKGEWMISYRYKSMMMDGIRQGTDDLSTQEVLALPNPNAPPANVRVVPTEMTMDMHMIGAMYGATDWLTIMAMGMVMKKEMEHLTHNMAGNHIGGFKTTSSGIGDTSLSTLIRLYDDNKHHLHLNLGISAPTGSIKEEDQVLAPNGSTPILRLPYAMQLGTGTWDLLPGLTYTGTHNKWGWGAQYKAAIRLESENDQGYSWGDKHQLQAWAAYQATSLLQTSTRLSFETMDDIDGADNRIAAPVSTANPDNYGGDIIELGLGLNLTPQSYNLDNHELGLEIAMPLYQDLNGAQMKRDWTATIGWKFTF